MKYEATANGISIEFNTDSIDKLFDRFRLNYEEFKHKLVEYKENNRTRFNYIQEISLSKCKPNKDFGKGFYLTTIKEQAIRMSLRVSRMMIWH